MTWTKSIRVSYDNTRCGDCCQETHPYEWYMVEDEVWRQAMIHGHVAFLCVACLEIRIKRRLTVYDFKLVPLNFQSCCRSERLTSRMGDFVDRFLMRLVEPSMNLNGIKSSANEHDS